MKISTKFRCWHFLIGTARPGTPDWRKFETPLRFEPNVHEAAADVRFISRGTRPKLLLKHSEVAIVLGRSTVRMQFVGATARDRRTAARQLLFW